MNEIINASAERMEELGDESVGLMVTSPPYNVGKAYESHQSFQDWLQLCRNVMTEVHRVLVIGGRACINVANTGRNPFRPLHFYVTEIMFDLGFLMRGEIIWVKAPGCNIGTAWGSWMSASNPVLRDVHEHILIFSKSQMRRDKTGRDTIIRDQFLEYTKSVWPVPGESSCRIGHPTPFPFEIPRRLITLYSFTDDIVLDPFCGSGTTCVAALLSGRSYVGYDIVPEYCELARRRLEQIQGSSEAERLGKLSDREEGLSAGILSAI